MSRDPLPQLQSLVYFESAARLLNFTAAAEELSTTQPAVSHRVRKMEESLGIPLFRRLHRGVVLTDEGRRISRTGHGTLPPPAPHLVRILAIVRALEREPRSESPS